MRICTIIRLIKSLFSWAVLSFECVRRCCCEITGKNTCMLLSTSTFGSIGFIKLPRRGVCNNSNCWSSARQGPLSRSAWYLFWPSPKKIPLLHYHFFLRLRGFAADMTPENCCISNGGPLPRLELYFWPHASQAAKAWGNNPKSTICYTLDARKLVVFLPLAYQISMQQKHIS